ncbi:MAG: Stage V sporulation protein E Required for spore cortex synthesi [Parcubacteria group bacterium Greene0416_79]|nr:MAG: Stage V sporulation protein E Required for spore cortex synthesi [Parcubacteria group bacterium Greene0416_79]
MNKQIDRIFLGIVIALVGVGFAIFVSASVGLLARTGASFGTLAGRQILAICIGALAAYALSRFHYQGLRKYALPFLILSIGVTLLVFVPGIGISHGGANRWISLFGFSFQPAELLKIAMVIYYAAFLSTLREETRSALWGLLPLLLLLALSGALLLTQPDTDAFLVLGTALVSMFLLRGGRLLHIGAACLLCAGALASLILIRPYLLERVLTFFNPAGDPQGGGYQIQQSLIAIGSGGWFGRGFGQSVQKFSYLPEPVGDSIFAVAAEEFGFIGAALLVLLFLLFVLRGLRIASSAKDSFGGLLAGGIVILISASAFVNMASMLGLIPLSGLPLSFVSHGGSALLFSLAEVGIVLNVSRYQRT